MRYRPTAFLSSLLFLLALSGPLYGQSGFSPEKAPEAAPPYFKILLGEYVSDDSSLIVMEIDGSIYAGKKGAQPVRFLQAGFRSFLAEGRTNDRSAELTFEGKPGIRPRYLEWGRSRFERHPFDGEDGKTFTITPLHSFDELQRRAGRATPPQEDGEFRRTNLVELHSLDSTIRYDIRYATTNNFMKQKFYTRARAYMQRPAAEAFVRAHRWLEQYGYGLLVHDAYRPWRVTKMFWDATPQDLKDFVANPAQGSRHNRGCAVDVTLFDRSTGEPIEMVSGYDEFSERSYPDYPGGTSLQRWHRALLRKALEREGFRVYFAEWWHFDYGDWKKYRIGNTAFEELDRGRSKR